MPTTRSSIELRRIVSTVRASAGTSSGAVSRSLISRIEPDFSPWRSSSCCASCNAAETRVPARNVSTHGLTVGPRAGGTSSRNIGRSSEAGVPGGSSS